MLELNFHSRSSIHSSQWFACLASHTSLNDTFVTHPSYFLAAVVIHRSRERRRRVLKFGIRAWFRLGSNLGRRFMGFGLQ
ncbi:hypothetical protein IGI04_007487 [Brassica rapa subsp. trilocularis]|uniref:Uncharacterized protein n=1 Tax=Brassica rapa subsp. trilocularis TaxID=1813537 RepID=A0ABQ7NJV5_BRACM|nr:hypothetical protein IGI04_007487 [Brassica rapa subsp. trilocularis]